jgi:hypothetical protein
MNILARVANISGIFITIIKKELKRPTTRLVTRAIRIEGNVGKLYHIRQDTTTALDRDATDPTERSNPPTEREVETPMAMTVTIEIERRILIILLEVRKLGAMIPKKAIRTITVRIVPHL